MIRHLVIVNFQQGLHGDYAGLLEKTKPLVEAIDGVVSYQIFSNESRYVPEGVVSFGVEIVFQDREALERFMNHPNHYEANALFEHYLADPPYMVLTHPTG